ncbi:Amino acid transporter, transmembrane domain containing protein [Parasponia andersonii]|uniref:Amino acid transporter, transmembrane domain containing protein n=1 Tax=Parasponia andersonii TaxID=3476 RepID=A0A2P5DA03_PARAD|nr:Amino acid transporter, transmembrane domain containing protein [Parasponia andersonii]
MEERPETELISIPATPRGVSTPEIQTPTGQRSPRPASKEAKSSTAWTPTSFISPRFLSPIGTPMKRVLINMKGYLEEVGHLTKLNPQDAWLPITESRNGNAHYAAFHNLNAGVGFQALVLPVAFAFLGWREEKRKKPEYTSGLVLAHSHASWKNLTNVFDLLAVGLIDKLHEAVPGKRYNRYVELAQAAFGERLGVWLALFPTVYLSAGTATALILIGGETMKLFFQIVCGPLCSSNPLTTVEWYLVFTSLCIVLSQLPNLNSIAGLSLVGAVTAITYSTMVWVLSVSQQRPPTISYEPMSLPSFSASVFSVLNALGIVAFAFRGHNLVLEIQATMPSTFKHPAHVPMWRGAKVAYFFIALCLFPVAIGGYWAYGNLMPSGGILNALYGFHSHDIPRGLLAMTFLLVVFNCLSSFQIYSMPVFDSFEAGYTSRTNRPCSIWVRSGFRVFYGFVSFFIGVALPFLSSLAGLLGGLTLPVTFAYPCFMWVLIKKPTKYSFNWYFNWILGWLGIAFSLAFSIGGVWSMVNNGLKLKFFKPPN